jgi:hypothetical protein
MRLSPPQWPKAPELLEWLAAVAENPPILAGLPTPEGYERFDAEMLRFMTRLLKPETRGQVYNIPVTGTVATGWHIRLNVADGELTSIGVTCPVCHRDEQLTIDRFRANLRHLTSSGQHLLDISDLPVKTGS